MYKVICFTTDFLSPCNQQKSINLTATQLVYFIIKFKIQVQAMQYTAACKEYKNRVHQFFKLTMHAQEITDNTDTSQMHIRFPVMPHW